MQLTKVAKFIIAYYIFILVWWTYTYFINLHPESNVFVYQFAFGLIPLFGGIAGIYRSKKWGMFNSKVGLALFFISAGLVTWGIGQMFWALYYNWLLQIEIPYPSLADIGYILSWPLWTIGTINLSYATGAKFSLKNVKGRAFLYIIPLLLIAISYYLLIVVARQGLLSDFEGGAYKIFFDLAYPIGDVVILSLAVLVYGLSFSYLGGKFKWPIIAILLGFLVNYIVDFSFSYTTTNGTYFNGHWVDILFPTAMALIAFGVNSFDTKDS